MVLADSVRAPAGDVESREECHQVFRTPGSSISISTINDPPGGLTIEFADHGIGIEAELLPRVFDAFQQGDHPMRHHHGGLGLGLFIARGLAETQGGTLTAHSEGRRANGATLRLTLPIIPPGEVASPEEKHAGFFPPITNQIL